MKPSFRSTFSRVLIVLFSAVLVIGYACKKNSSENHPAPPPPVTPDLTTKVSTSVSGYVTNEADSAVVFATVSAGDQQTTTDRYGYFSFSQVSLSQASGLIKVVSNGHFNGYRSFIPVANKSSFVRIRVLSKTETGTVDAAAGGQVSTSDGGIVVLPAEGIVNASNGSAYTGTVHVAARWIDPSDDNNLQLDVPGDSRGTDSVGHLKGLKSYGMLTVELTTDGGQLLQIAPGKTAGIQIPIASALSGTAPASITLWSFNDTTGLWRQDGSAVKTGNSYVGTTKHFSFWDGAEAMDLVNFKARIVDASSNPLVNVPVSVTLANMPQNAGFGKFGFTDAYGNITGSIPANSNLVFEVLTPCAIAAYEHSFSSTAAAIDLGQMTGNLGQNEVTLSGTVANCSKQPVTNGYVQTYDHGFYNRFPITSGSFSFTGVSCTNTPVNIVAVDNDTYMQSDPQTVTLTPGLNNLGALTACGSSTMGSMSYTIDGVTTNLVEPKDTIAAYYIGAASDTSSDTWTQIVTLSGNANQAQQMSFQFDGGMDPAAKHSLSEVFSTSFPGGRAYWPTPLPITISDYGPIGGFVSGNFSFQMVDINNTAVHTVSCTFRVRRYN